MSTPNKAQLFQAAHRDYFFQDAHFLVEASASKEARELHQNVFQFDDGSILQIQASRMLHKTFSSLTEFQAYASQG